MAKRLPESPRSGRVKRLLAAMSREAADQKRHLGEQPFGFSQRRLATVVLGIRIVEREILEAEAQRIHRHGVSRHEAEPIRHRRFAV
jgi:hypothetical protein